MKLRFGTSHNNIPHYFIKQTIASNTIATQKALNDSFHAVVKIFMHLCHKSDLIEFSVTFFSTQYCTFRNCSHDKGPMIMLKRL